MEHMKPKKYKKAIQSDIGKSNFFEWYKKNFFIPPAFKKRVAISNAKAAICVYLPLNIFTIAMVIFGSNVIGVVEREIYFGGLAFLSLLGFVHALMILTLNKMPAFIRDSISVYGMAFALVFSIYDMYTSSMYVNGLLVLIITCLLTIIIMRVEPTIFTVMLLVPAAIMLPKYMHEYGRDLFTNSTIIFTVFILLAYLERKRFVKNMRQERRLIDATRKAREADRAKSSFLARMSHEIRSPINAVLGLDEMILRESSEEPIRQYAEEIRSSGRTLLSVINDVLDFSRIESGRMELYPVEFDTATVLNDVHSMIVPRGRDKGLEMILNVNPDIPHILYGDEVRIRQIATNILTNAVKYTDKGSVTTNVDFVKINENHIDIKISVTDTGRGIREEDMDALVKPYARLDEQSINHIEGTGLGISICVQLLKLMDSELKVESVYGMGSTFSFEIPLEVRDWTPISEFSGKIQNENLAKKKHDAYRVSFTAPEAKLLAVDDIPINLTVFTNLLKETKMQIDTALSGNECLAKAAQNDYDIILLDHMMPDMDGVETMYRLRTSEDMNYKSTPIIVVTANAITGMRENYLREGFTDYISKPIDTENLEKILIQYLPPQKVTLCEETATTQEKEITEDDYICSLVEEDGSFALEEAVSMLGGRELYGKVFKEFRDTIDYRAEKIEKLLTDGDIKNFTIEVHALKSSARMIGANDLSEHAKILEECGKNGEIEIIFGGAGELIEEYRGLGSKMSQIIEKAETEFREARGIFNLPEITENEIEEGLQVMKEAIEVFDFDVAMAVMESFAAHKLPTGFKSVYEKLKVLMAEVAREEITKVIDDYLLKSERESE